MPPSSLLRATHNTLNINTPHSYRVLTPAFHRRATCSRCRDEIAFARRRYRYFPMLATFDFFARPRLDAMLPRCAASPLSPPANTLPQVDDARPPPSRHHEYLKLFTPRRRRKPAHEVPPAWAAAAVSSGAGARAAVALRRAVHDAQALVPTYSVVLFCPACAPCTSR